MRVCISRTDIVANAGLKESEKKCVFFQFSACVLSLVNACIIEGRLFSPIEWNLGKKSVTSYMGDGTGLSDTLPSQHAPAFSS